MSNFSYFFREVYINMKRNVLMSAASISTVLILSLMLGFFIIIVMNLNYWSENLVKQLQIVVYISDDFNERQIKVLKSSLETTAGVSTITYIPKDEALKKLREKLKNQLELSEIGKNPLPNSFEITVSEPGKIPHVASLIRHYPGIEKVRYGENITSKLISINKAVHWVGIIIVSALLISTIFIVSNTIRITVFARRKEISIMQLVGAANWFIRWPFILEGVLQGVIGSLISVILLKVAYGYLIPKVHMALPFLIMVPAHSLIALVTLTLLGTGFIVGAAGSLISVNKFLRLQ
ncbi:MAG: permease-like cell division protein FtsX [Candidatus Eremiobacteraeota bacterium]|nr:permease-like cell division protein FtsX [Candidatus Eremiobacteraeota bacterium]